MKVLRIIGLGVGGCLLFAVLAWTICIFVIKPHWETSLSVIIYSSLAGLMMGGWLGARHKG